MRVTTVVTILVTVWASWPTCRGFSPLFKGANPLYFPMRSQLRDSEQTPDDEKLIVPTRRMREDLPIHVDDPEVASSRLLQTVCGKAVQVRAL